MMIETAEDVAHRVMMDMTEHGVPETMIDDVQKHLQKESDAHEKAIKDYKNSVLAKMGWIKEECKNDIEGPNEYLKFKIREEDKVAKKYSDVSFTELLSATQEIFLCSNGALLPFNRKQFLEHKGVKGKIYNNISLVDIINEIPTYIAQTSKLFGKDLFLVYKNEEKPITNEEFKMVEKNTSELTTLVKKYFLSEKPEKLITDDQLKDFGYKIDKYNSKFEEAEVIFIGNTHNKHDEEISSLLENIISDGDKVFIEGQESGKNLNYLLNECDENFIYPELYGIKKSGKKVDLIGADDISKRDKAVEYVQELIETVEKIEKIGPNSELHTKFTCLKNIIDMLNFQRENTFYETILQYMKKSSKNYFIVGSKHIKDGNLTEQFNNQNMKYVAISPIDGRNSVEHAKAYFGKKKIEDKRTNNRMNKSNMVFEVELPNGQSECLGYAWFGRHDKNYKSIEEVEKISVGDSITFVGINSEADMKRMSDIGLLQNQDYKILRIL